MCGTGCPRGSTFISYNPGRHDRCDVGDIDLQEGCEAIKPLSELGYRSGHKTRFCKARGYTSMTNYARSDYRDYGGGFCFRGERQACTASLPYPRGPR